MRREARAVGASDAVAWGWKIVRVACGASHLAIRWPHGRHTLRGAPGWSQHTPAGRCPGPFERDGNARPRLGPGTGPAASDLARGVPDRTRGAKGPRALPGESLITGRPCIGSGQVPSTRTGAACATSPHRCANPRVSPMNGRGVHQKFNGNIERPHLFRCPPAAWNSRAH